jgi:hypothetical protein
LKCQGALSVLFVVEPASLVIVAIGCGQYAPSVSFVVDPLTNVDSAICVLDVLSSIGQKVFTFVGLMVVRLIRHVCWKMRAAFRRSV